MVERFFTQLESLAFRIQERHLKKVYPGLSGVKIGRGFLWQHPGSTRERILARYRQKVASLDKVV